MEAVDPTELRHYLQNEELAVRRKGEHGGLAAEIIRYGAFVGSEIEHHERLGRAMDRAREHIDAEERRGRAVRSGRLILAGSLSGSKGRFTRSWHAPPGGLWGCLLHADALLPQSAMLLSFAVGIAACETIRGFGLEAASLRWVNDVLVGQAKVGGFLIESHTGPCSGERFHLVGFGINVNNDDFPAELRDSADCLRRLLGADIELQRFLLDFAAKLVWNIGLLYFVEASRPDWAQPGSDFRHPVVERWQQLSDSVGRRVVFGHDVMTRPQYEGVVDGIAADGGLQIILDDGLRLTEHSGEIRYLS